MSKTSACIPSRLLTVGTVLTPMEALSYKQYGQETFLDVLLPFGCRNLQFCSPVILFKSLQQVHSMCILAFHGQKQFLCLKPEWKSSFLHTGIANAAIQIAVIIVVLFLYSLLSIPFSRYICSYFK